MLETGSYGNKFNGSAETDGLVEGGFLSTGNDFTLTFTGYDIDNNSEVRLLLNGVSLGNLTKGVNNGFSYYEFTITAAQQLAGENVLAFQQIANTKWKWGITDILLTEIIPEPVIPLTVGVLESGKYGNNFDGSADVDGVLEVTFTGTANDLDFSFKGFDIDHGNELEIFLNGTSLGILPAGVNQGLADYNFLIPFHQQLAGENVLRFEQLGDPAFAWGVTDMLLTEIPPNISSVLSIGVMDSTDHGNNFNGTTDADGVVHVSFTGSTDDLVFRLTGYDIDHGNELEVYLNGVSLGRLTTGVNLGFSFHEFQISAAQQLAGDNTISFVQLGDPSFSWGVTDLVLLPPEQPVPLTVGVLDANDYGNNFNGSLDRDGVLDLTFAGTTSDLGFTFDGFDIDVGEIEVLLNGQSRGVLDTGVNNGLASYSVLILAADQLTGENVISFVQLGQPYYQWGVTELLLTELPDEPIVGLQVGVMETGDYGNDFNGSIDRDGVLHTTFTGTADSLVLRLAGYDIDDGNELEVLLNGASLGLLTAGVDLGLSFHEFQISAAQQLAGQNTISFVQLGDPTTTWGVTDIVLLPPEQPVPLTVGVLDANDYGNNFNGSLDRDGILDLTFAGTTDDIQFTFEGFDIDVGEIEVFFNGQSRGVLAVGVNNDLASYSLDFLAEDQLAGENVVSFVQLGQPYYKWGVTDLLLTVIPPDLSAYLDVGVMEFGDYGNNFNGQSDPDGEINFGFDGTIDDLVLRFTGYDIDHGNELELFLNGVSLGKADEGVNKGFSLHEFQISAAQQLAGPNVISFVQLGNPNFAWGVTDIVLLPPELPTALTVGNLDTGDYGNNFNGSLDRDGVLDFTFAGSSSDLDFTFDGFDIDVGEVEVFVNGESRGILDTGVNDQLASYNMLVLERDQLVGENTISFVQLGQPYYKWGFTDLLLTELPDEPVITLELETLETGEYGNHFNSATDRNGILDAEFTGTGQDLLLRFAGYDIDHGGELEVLINGVSLGNAARGVNLGMSYHEFRITAAQQQAGVNTISFVQLGDPAFAWGVTDIVLNVAPETFTPTDTNYAEQWHLQKIGRLEEIWAEYTGAGVYVAAYDDGMQTAHHDLDDNVDTSGSPIVNGQAIDPDAGTAQHGTAVTGVIAAEANGFGTVGVAFNASITAVDIIDGPASSNVPNLSGFIQAMSQMTNFDVVNHSWSWAPTFDPIDPATADFYAQTLPTLENASDNGRGGLGTPLVRASGNDSGSAQGDLLTVSRHTITVGAVDDTGEVSSYSNRGANVVVTAPSSGGFLSSSLAIKTTDRLGFEGYAFGDYTGTDSFTGFGGTSSAAPVVTGVIALMLEANPDLGWRDVQTILSYSATHTGTLIGQTPAAGSWELHDWTFNDAVNWNGGGLHFSEDYGHGMVDAYNAVRLAETWSLFGAAQTSANDVSFSISGSPNIAVGSGVTINLDMMGMDLNVEHIDVSIEIADLTVEIYLISPDGTRMELFRPFDTLNALDWTFGIQGLRGSQLDGIWQLEVVNTDADNPILVDYSVNWWGQSDGVHGYDAANDVYHFTDEIFSDIIFDAGTGTASAIVDDTARTTIDDTDGGADWLNFSAMTGNINVTLSGGSSATFNGQPFMTIAAGGVFENAIGGSGNDSLTGNAGDNVLVGMRGHDTLMGLEGSDQLDGRTGNDDLWGGLDSDTFLFADDFGVDTIHDFESDLITLGPSDIVDFTGVTEVASFASFIAAMTDTQLGAVYDFGSDGVDVLTFAGLNISDLTSSDFVF